MYGSAPEKETSRRNDRHRPGRDCRLLRTRWSFPFWHHSSLSPLKSVVSPISSSLSMRDKELTAKAFVFPSRSTSINSSCCSPVYHDFPLRKDMKQIPWRACCGSPVEHLMCVVLAHTTGVFTRLQSIRVLRQSLPSAEEQVARRAGRHPRTLRDVFLHIAHVETARRSAGEKDSRRR